MAKVTTRRGSSEEIAGQGDGVIRYGYTSGGWYAETRLGPVVVRVESESLEDALGVIARTVDHISATVLGLDSELADQP